MIETERITDKNKLSYVCIDLLKNLTKDFKKANDIRSLYNIFQFFNGIS